MTYQPKTFRSEGGDKFTVKSGGEIELQTGAVFDDQRWDGSIAVAGATLAIPVTARYAAKTTGGVEALTLANGTAGHVLTISLVVDGGTGTLTPATASGWATAVFADAGDTLTVEYIDDTVGWIVLGSTGVAAPPVITI